MTAYLYSVDDIQQMVSDSVCAYEGLDDPGMLDYYILDTDESGNPVKPLAFFYYS